MIIDPETRDVIEPGYNGAPAGHPDCLDGACPRGRHRPHIVIEHGLYTGKVIEEQRCAWDGQLWPCSDSSVPGSNYDNCIAIHAEANAIIRAGRRARGAWMYLTHGPCDGCRKLIMGAGITRVVWRENGETREWLPSRSSTPTTSAGT